MSQAQYGTIVGIIKPQGHLTGMIKPQSNLRGVISKTVEEVERQNKEITITENGIVEVMPDANKLLQKVTITTDVIGGDVAEYQGSYEVTPTIQEQVLPTALKVMRNDLTVKEIPYAEVSNASGGTTIIIG
jgi:hypothetical protein